MTEPPAPEETLDPADWDAFRELAHRMVDDTLAHLATLRDRAPWQPMPPGVRAALRDAPLPRGGEGEAAAYAQFREQVLPYPNGNLHPRFWGWVQGTGTPLGMMAEMLAAAMNPHLAGFDQAPALVEHQVVRWLAELMGFPANAGGVLVTGGTMANLLGLAVARHARAGWDVRAEGMEGGPRLTVYGSSETHGWIGKAVELMGMGRRSFRAIPVDSAYRIDVDALAAAVREDRAAGHRPFCVIGTAGTVNTGATDDLAALADLCAAEGLWFHVDGAFGAWAYASDALRPRVAGMERADSLGFDLHKWGYLPFECACVLVRDAQAHRAAFASTAPYLVMAQRGPTAGGLPFADRGIDLTRGFKALKVWMSFKAHGVDAIVRLVEQNVAQAQYLAARVTGSPALELLAPVPLNVVCFRYAPAGLSEARRNAVNEEVLVRLQEGGIAVPSGTTLRGRYALRAAIVNHRTRREDLDALVDAVERMGREVAEGCMAEG